MSDELDNITPEEIARGASEFVMYLEERDSQECIYTYEALMRRSVMLYDFRGTNGIDK